MSFSDLQIKTRIRSVLAKHWIDPTSIKFDCCTGTVRFRGELRLVKNEESAGTEKSLVETLEEEIKRIPGVRKVYFMGVKLGLYDSK